MAQAKDEKTKKWFYYGNYTDSNGERRQYKKRGFDLQREAKEAERIFRKKVAKGEVSLKTKKTFKDVTEEYLKNDTQSKASTKQSDKELFKKLNLVIGDVALKSLSTDTLQDYVNELDAKYSKNYVQKIYYVINKVLEFAIFKNYILINPMKKVKSASRKDEIKKDIVFWEPSQFKQFINAVDKENDHMYYVLFNFLYYMGCRRSEALALQWKDVDFSTSSISIYKTVTYRIKGIDWLITSPKTKNSNRTITMPKSLFEIMKEWQSNQEQMYEFTAERFIFGYDRPLAPNNLRRRLERYTELANLDKENKPLPQEQRIPKIRVHDLRHSHASFLINNMSAGFTDFDIAQRLGDTVKTLHDTYAHWFKQADKGIIDFMNKEI